MQKTNVRGDYRQHLAAGPNIPNESQAPFVPTNDPRSVANWELCFWSTGGVEESKGRKSKGQDDSVSLSLSDPSTLRESCNI